MNTIYYRPTNNWIDLFWANLTCSNVILCFLLLLLCCCCFVCMFMLFLFFTCFIFCLNITICFGVRWCRGEFGSMDKRDEMYHIEPLDYHSSEVWPKNGCGCFIHYFWWVNKMTDTNNWFDSVIMSCVIWFEFMPVPLPHEC